MLNAYFSSVENQSLIKFIFFLIIHGHRRITYRWEIKSNKLILEISQLSIRNSFVLSLTVTR